MHYVNSQQMSILTDLMTTRERYLNTYKEKRLKEYLTVSKIDKVCVFKILTNYFSKQVSVGTTMMLALILILCLSVGQVQSLEKRNEMSQDTEVTATTTVQGEIMRNNYIFQFDINTKGWQIFTNWKLNEPLATMYGEITYSVNVGNQNRQHLLISGANSPLSYLEKKKGIFANWLYTVNTNSWQNVDNGDFPPLFSSPVMVQLCNKIVDLETDELRRGKVFNLTGAWIFDTVLLNWQKTQVDVDDSPPFWFHYDSTETWNLQVAAVAVQVQSQNNCRCNQTAFVLLHSSDFRISTYEVRCVNQNGTERYECINLTSDIQKRLLRSQVKYSPGINFLASSYSSTIVLYDPANQTLWKFENRTWTNVTAVSYNLQSFQSHKFGCTVASNYSIFIVFNNLDNKVLNFDLKRNSFIIKDVAGEIPDQRYNIVSTLAEKQNTIIFFTLDELFEKTIVWKFIYKRKL